MGTLDTCEYLEVYKRIFQHAREGIVVTNRNSEIISVNPAFSRITGYSEEQAVGKRSNLLNSGCHDPLFFIEMWAVIHMNGSWIGEIWNRRKNGEVHPVRLQIHSLYNEKEEITHYVGIFNDLTEQKKVEENLRLYQRVFENASEGILITDTKGIIQTVNPAFTKTTGYLKEEIQGQSPSLLQSGVQNKPFYINMWTSIHETGNWQGEIWNSRKSGEIYPEWLSINAVKDKSGKITNYVGIFTDISERKETENRLLYLAHNDVLTGLPNRTFFYERLQQAIKQAKQRKEVMAILFLDLDRFKSINDTMGHTVGDQFLIHIANQVRQCLRKSDLVARLGGDEFTVLLTGVQNIQDIVGVAKKILNRLSEPFILDNQEFSSSVSIGISLYPMDGEDVESLVKNADLAMYEAKTSGKNQFYFYSPDAVETNSRKSILEQCIRKALERHEFELYYQPQVNVLTNKIVSVEALLRWRNADLGDVSPVEFIPIAEETRLIIPLGDWVLWEACKQSKAWLDKGYKPIKMSVNISVRQFQNPNFIETLKSILKTTGISPAFLELEITENINLHDIKSIIPILTQIRELGIGIAIDDFGTGYSSLSYLKQYPINSLKIDKSLVQQVHTNPSNELILKGIIDIAHGLKLTVVAEGVETKEELLLLKQQGCDLVQGYLFSKPVQAKLVEECFVEVGIPL